MTNTSTTSSMDPQNPASFNHSTQKLSTGRTYHFVDQLPRDYDHKQSPTLLCVHGFPDLWYGWRYQISPWVSEGYRVIIPDMLGYGGTDKPREPSEYSTQKLCADLAALLDHLNIRRAVLIGHDWGAFTASRFALWYPERLLALIILSVPYSPPSRVYISVEDVGSRIPNLGYQADFANPASTLEIEHNLPKFLSMVFRPNSSTKENYTHRGTLFQLLRVSEVPKDPSLLTDAEFEYYTDQLRKGGMNGPLNYYRTAKYRHEEEERAGLAANLPENLPVLFIWGTADPTATPSVISKARKFISQLQDLAFEGKGHWLMVEAKEEIAHKVVHWLRETGSRPVGKL